MHQIYVRNNHWNYKNHLCDIFMYMVASLWCIVIFQRGPFSPQKWVNKEKRSSLEFASLIPLPLPPKLQARSTCHIYLRIKASLCIIHINVALILQKIKQLFWVPRFGGKERKKILFKREKRLGQKLFKIF